MKLTDDEKMQIVSAMDGNKAEPQSITEKVTDIVGISPDDLPDGESKAIVCCRYYSMGRYRYARTAETNCRAVVGQTVPDSYC